MRAAQGAWLELDPALFYQLLTAHGAGMVGTAALSGAAIMWYFVGRYLPLSGGIYWAFLGLFLLGRGLDPRLRSFIGGYGGGWTFLYPLPAVSGGVHGKPGRRRLSSSDTPRSASAFSSTTSRSAAA